MSRRLRKAHRQALRWRWRRPGVVVLPRVAAEVAFSPPHTPPEAAEKWTIPSRTLRTKVKHSAKIHRPFSQSSGYCCPFESGSSASWRDRAHFLAAKVAEIAAALE